MMPLKPACEDLYHNMVSEVYATQQPGLSAASRITLCFKICVEYWTRLKALLKDYHFENEEEEIWFFKLIKPKFTALLEYYTLIHNATLNEENTHQFWEKEKEKINNFYRQYKEFCAYYKSGSTSMDHIYFLRKNAAGCKDCYNELYDTGNNFITAHGNTISSLLAFDMYDAYIMQQDHVSL